MATINKNYDKLAAGYLFPEIGKRRDAFLKSNPHLKLGDIMKLGVGDTSEPLTHTIIKGLHLGVDKLASKDTYTGYGTEQGDKRLRQALADRYGKRGVKLEFEEIFVSDGAKPDSANIQSIFSKDSVVAVQDPAYPVYVDSNVIAGRTKAFVNGKYEGLVYMPCTVDKGFFPDLPNKKVDLIYLCSPNNPTGAVATKDQLRVFIDYARLTQAVIIFDAAYSAYISDPELPRSIYEVEGAKECAIEISSFSKDAGFTGVRLGWTVVPKTIITAGEDPNKLNSLWNRRQTTMFNGASNIVQEGGLAAMLEIGQRECQGVVDYYMENARIIKWTLEKMGFKVFGGLNAPYLWVKLPNGMKSWEFFDKLLSEAHVLCTPGVGFGPSGEGYVRFSAFGHREDIEKAAKSIRDNLRL